MIDVKKLDNAICKRKQCLKKCDGCGNMKVNKPKCIRKVVAWENAAFMLVTGMKLQR
jgi:hypothetical protein